MFQIDLKSRKAIYEQIVDNFKRLISTGVLKKDEKVPSIREMAKILAVNPNTIQKAYRELENQNYFYTILGQGSFISAPPEFTNVKEIRANYGNLKTIINELMFFGESEEDILEFVRKECANSIKRN